MVIRNIWKNGQLNGRSEGRTNDAITLSAIRKYRYPWLTFLTMCPDPSRHQLSIRPSVKICYYCIRSHPQFPHCPVIGLVYCVLNLVYWTGDKRDTNSRTESVICQSPSDQLSMRHPRPPRRHPRHGKQSSSTSLTRAWPTPSCVHPQCSL